MRGNIRRHIGKWVLSTYTHCIDDMTNHPAVDCVPGWVNAKSWAE